MLNIGFDVVLNRNTVKIEELDFVVTGEAVPVAKIQGEQQAAQQQQMQMQPQMMQQPMQQQQQWGMPPQQAAPPHPQQQEVPQTQS